MVSLQGSRPPVRLPDNSTLKVALLAAAATNPALEHTLFGRGGQTTRQVPARIAALRATRAQSIAFELYANSGRYCSRTDGAALTKKRDLGVHPLVWVVLPVNSADDARLFAPAGDAEGARLRQQLFRTLTLPGRTEPLQVMLLPVHWEEAKTLQEKFPDLAILEDGLVYRSSSPRSLFISPEAGQQPRLVADLEHYGIKTHLSKETYARLGGLTGSRELNFNDALFASVLSTEFAAATRDLPFIEVQSEARAVAARVGTGDDAIEVGAIFRKLIEEPAVPGFAFFSRTQQRLPWVTRSDLVSVRADRDARYLMADAIQFAVRRNPGLTARGAFIKLFVDPLLDVNFALFTRGWSMELHPQNFLLKVDPQTGLTTRVVIRDLHGLGYSAAYRAERGLPDQFALANLKRSYPDITQQDINGYFMREGALRPRYTPAQMFHTSIDFFTSIFWYHLLDAGLSSELFTKRDVNALIETIRDRVEVKAREHGFDLRQLAMPEGAKTDYWDAHANGIRGRVLFRRAG